MGLGAPSSQMLAGGTCKRGEESPFYTESHKKFMKERRCHGQITIIARVFKKVFSRLSPWPPFQDLEVLAC